MPVELRKRKAPQPAPAPAPPAKRAGKAKAKTAAALTAAPAGKHRDEAAKDSAPPAKPAKVAVGDVVALDGFGGVVETHDGSKTSLKALVDASKAGVVLFTYPKASTPGCEHPPPFPRRVAALAR